MAAERHWRKPSEEARETTNAWLERKLKRSTRAKLQTEAMVLPYSCTVFTCRNDAWYRGLHIVTNDHITSYQTLRKSKSWSTMHMVADIVARKMPNKCLLFYFFYKGNILMPIDTNYITSAGSNDLMSL
jgi:hypothetical protein